MSHTQGKLGLLLVAIGAVMAVSAAPAIANHHPDLPYDDSGAENWSAVQAGAVAGEEAQLCNGTPQQCNFSSGQQTWTWRFGSESPEDCSGSIAGYVDGDGNVSITSASLVGEGGGECSQTVSQLPWPGTICKHESTDTYWVRQKIGVASSGSHPISFGQVGGPEINVGAEVPTITPIGLRFGDPLFGTFAVLGAHTLFGFVNWGNHQAEFPLWENGEVAMGAVPSGECNWPELS